MKKALLVSLFLVACSKGPVTPTLPTSFDANVGGVTVHGEQLPGATVSVERAKDVTNVTLDSVLSIKK